MNVLLLIALLCAAGALFAVPLFEFVFAALLIAPLIKFLIARGLLSAGVMVTGGFGDAALYLLGFSFVFLFTHIFFGRRKKPLTWPDFYPVAMFAGVFCLAYWMCLLWPDFIPMGERLRDYALLVSSIESPVVPKEPWMEGATLNYYVFWYRFGGMLNSLLHIPVWDAYHTILSFSLAFYAGTLFQVVRVVFGGSVIVAAFTALILPFGSNIAGVMGWKRAEAAAPGTPVTWWGTPPIFDTDNGWWGPSRVIRGAIDEFPAWSFLLGDAHPHFLNLATLPFFFLILFRIASSPAQAEKRLVQAFLFVVGATLFLIGSNAWEVPMWAGVAAIIGLVTWIVSSAGQNGGGLPALRDLSTSQKVRAVCCVLVLVLGLVFAAKAYEPTNKLTSLIIMLVALSFSLSAFPFTSGLLAQAGQTVLKGFDLTSLSFWIVLFVALKLSSGHISSGESGALTFVRDPVFFTSVPELWGHWGFHLFFISLATLLLFGLSLPTLFVALFMAVPLLYEKAAVFIYVLIGLQLVRFFTQRESEASWKDIFTEALTICSLGLLLLPEVVFLNDSYGGDNERMNTIFKIYTTDWALLGLAAVALCLRVYNRYQEQLEETSPGLLPAAAWFLGLVVIGASTQLYAHTVPMRMQRKDTPQRWSEGLSSPDRDNPGSATIIRVLRDKPKGVVLEGQGNPYSYTSFVSTLAAQPCYLGWANHVGLLTKKHEETGRRTKVTEEIYTGTECEARKALAKKEGIRYIVLGTLEKKKYPGVFDRDFGCLTLITHDRDYWLFEVD